MTNAAFSPIEQPVPLTPPEAAIEERGGSLPQFLNAAKRSAQLAIVGAELSPANEMIRVAAFGAGELYAHSPLMGAATLGISTLAIEGSAAIASASLFTSKTNDQINRFLRSKLEKRGYNPDRNMSTMTKGTATFFGGSVVGMALDKFDNQDMTTHEVRKSGLIKSAWLAGVLAVVGAAGGDTAPQAFEYTVHNPAVDAKVIASVGAIALARKAVNTLRKPDSMKLAETISEDSVWYDHDKQGNRYGLIKGAEQLAKAAVLEQDVWTEKGYGNLEEEGYTPYIEQSRTFAAFNGDTCVGVERIFVGNETIVPPFLGEDMPYYDNDERDLLIAEAKNGDIEELGTVALAPEYRGKDKRVNLQLFRLAYRDARARGIKKWGIIMEPERVEKMNKNYGFTFEQLGDTTPYQGGDCAAFVMDLDEVDKSMKRQHPLQHFWFVSKKISA